MPIQPDDYELLPHNELEYLRKEVERLKRNPLGDTQASIGLLESINRLNTNVMRLNDILASANDDMVKSFNETAMQEQMRKMMEQQEKLARGIVAVAELVKDVQRKQGELPTLDQFVPAPRAQQPAPAPAVSPQSMPVDAQPVVARNPFMENPDFQPILNQPLPRPAMPPQVGAFDGSLPQPLPQPLPGFQQPLPQPLPDFQGPQQAPQGFPQQSASPPGNAPGYMLNPGVKNADRIPDIEVPLPPPRRY